MTVSTLRSESPDSCKYDEGRALLDAFVPNKDAGFAPPRDGLERGNLNNDENYDLMISNMISISFKLIRTRR